MKTNAQTNSISGDAQYCPKVPLNSVTLSFKADVHVPRSDVAAALRRHQDGDWGDVDEEARRENEIALLQGGRLISSYSSSEGVTFLIVTRTDRSLTTVLLPSEFVTAVVC